MLEVDLHLAGDLPLAAGGGDEELHQLQQRPVPVHLKQTQSLRFFHTAGRYGSACLCRIAVLRIQIRDSVFFFTPGSGSGINLFPHLGSYQPAHNFGELTNYFLG